MAVQRDQNRILAVLSDVSFSPQLMAILNELQDRGATLRVILIGDRQLQIAQEIKYFGMNLKIIRKRSKFGSVSLFSTITMEILRNRPSTVFASGQFASIVGMLCAKLLGVPKRVFIRHHSNFHHKYNMKFGILLDQITNRSSTMIAAVSLVVQRILIADEGVSPTKIRMISNGVRLEEFQSRSLGKAFSKKSKVSFKIGVISRLTDWKGVEYTARAFVKLQEKFPNSYLHVIGAFSDSYESTVDILSSINRNSYELERERSDIPSFLSGLSAFVHVPIGPEDEAFGIVYVEALATGIPCIFTLSGVLNELPEAQKYADIVPFKNSDEIYLRLVALIEGTATRKIEAPSSWLDQYSLQEMAQRYSNLLLEAEKSV